jgi:hypothetical protein
MTVLTRSYYPVSPKSYFCASCSLLICLMYAMIDHLMNTYRFMELSHSPTNPPVLITSANFRASQHIGLAISRYSMRISSMVRSSYGSPFSIIETFVRSTHQRHRATLGNSINATSICRVLTIAGLYKQFLSVSLSLLRLNVDGYVFGIVCVRNTSSINNKSQNLTKLNTTHIFTVSHNIKLLNYKPNDYLINGQFEFLNDNLLING